MVKHTHTLSAMLTLYIGGGLLALGLLLGIAVAEGVGRLLEQAFHDKAEALARQLSTISLDAMLVSDYGTLERYLRDLKTQPGVRYLRVRRNDNEVLGEAGEPPQPNDTGHHVLVNWPIRLGGNRLGEVTVSYDTAPVRHAVRRISLWGAGGLILAVAALYFWLRRTLEHRIIRPVQAIAAQISLGDDNKDIPWDHMPEELTRIACTFAHLCARIEDTDRQREEAERMAHLPLDLHPRLDPSPLASRPFPPDATLAQVERIWIEQVLERRAGNKAEAAQRLSIDATTLYRKLKD